MTGFPLGLLSTSEGVVCRLVHLRRIQGFNQLYSSTCLVFANPDKSLVGQAIDEYGMAEISGTVSDRQLEVVVVYSYVTAFGRLAKGVRVEYLFDKKTPDGWVGTFKAVHQNGSMISTGTAHSVVTAIDLTDIIPR